MIEQSMPTKQLQCLACTALCRNAVSKTTQQTAVLCSLRTEKTVYRFSFHTIYVAIKIRFVRYGMHHNQFAIQACNDATMGEMAMRICHRHYVTFYGCAFTQYDVAFPTTLLRQRRG